MATKRISKEALIGSEIIFDNQDDDENVAITPNYMSNHIDIISLDGLGGDPVIPTGGVYKIYAQTDENGAFKSIDKNNIVNAKLTGGNLHADGVTQGSYFIGLPLKIKVVPSGIVGATAYRVLIKQNSEQIDVDGLGGALNEGILSAFGENLSVEPTPLLQITGQYGLLDDVLTAALGGSVDTINSNFRAQTLNGPNNVVAIISSREAQYKAGQGLACEITAIFTEGQPNSTQQAGFITSESAFGFGYNGDEFGIIYATDGELENQELTITTGATSNENASITVDGVNYSVPITNSTAERNAFEIAAYLNLNEPRYRFTSNGVKVYGLARLPDFGTIDPWLFSSGTAVGSWVQIKNGVIPTEIWIPKRQWNVMPDIDIDPTKGNVYKIQIQYLGYGGIIFSVENPKTAKIEKVHVLEYASTATKPSVSNPIFRVGWACRNTGNTSNIVVQGASGGAFVEGKIVTDARPHAACHTQTSIDSGVRQNLIAFRNRLTFNSKANRAEILPILLNVSNEAAKTIVVEIIKNPVVDTSTGFLEWGYADENEQLMEFANDYVRIPEGDVVGCFSIPSGSDKDINVQKLIKYHSPSEEFSITARITSGGTTGDVTISGNWEDDL